MIKLLLLTVAFSITQVTMAEVTNSPSKQTKDMAAVNMAHAAAKKAGKNVPFWTSAQSKQAALETKYKKAIAENPEDKKAYAFLAGLYLINNKNTKAIDAYQDAITYDAKNPKLFAALSIAYLHHSKYAMAKAMADQALKLDPKLTQVNKISEYITAKQDAIEAASKVQAKGGVQPVSYKGKGVAPHGSVMPTATGKKPSDLTHGIAK